MRFFIDTEFIEYPCTIDLISLGIVAEDKRELYLVNADCDWSHAHAWVLEHVKPHVLKEPLILLGKSQMASTIKAFIGEELPEFYGYYSAYDWVVFCWLFGAMVDLPRGWPMYCCDLRQWLDARGLAHVKQPDDMPHHALSDARWICETYLHYASLVVDQGVKS